MKGVFSMGQYYLGIDIGASSGRHILGSLEDGKLVFQEIHRFENGMSESEEGYIWDADRLFEEILTGMKKCKEIGIIPASVGIDTWGVDFVLLDDQDKRIGDMVAYRNDRTRGMDEIVYQTIAEKDLYSRIGIQKQLYNTIYQLMAVKEQHPERLERATSFLTVPDYFHYLLSGVKVNEYTEATTTGLVDPKTKNWDYDLIHKLGYPAKMFCEIKEAGTNIGNLTDEIQKKVGFNCEVILPASHDTGSAVVAVPSNEEDTLYISSGTWSLMGIERMKEETSEPARIRNFTNEGGYLGRYRFLKNIMGLWMIQSIKKELFQDKSYQEICEQASLETIGSLVDCNDERFLAPKSMSEEVRAYLRETMQEVPKTDCALASIIYNSLAATYQKTIEEIEELTGIHYDKIHIIGGGSNATYLNTLTANYTGRKVVTGPSEATAIGNIIVQMLTKNEFNNLKEARSCIYRSFDINEI